VKARIVTLALLSAALLPGELRLYTLTAAGGETELKGQLDMGSVPSGDYRDQRMRIRNRGEASVTLERLRITGAGFSLQGNPTLPYIVAPGTNVDFRVRFQPASFGSYSASLRVNDTYYTVLGSSPATLSVSFEEESGFRRLVSGETVALGRVEQGGRLSKRFRLENATNEDLTVSRLEVEGRYFGLDPLPGLPLRIPRASTVEFTVVYAPGAAGIHRGQLAVGDRTFPLEGFALAPPFPAPALWLETETPVSGRQVKLGVRLASPSPADGEGEIRMSFEPLPERAPDDPGVLFLASGSRKIPFTVNKGGSEASFGGAGHAVFQTGTTAGTIRFAVSLGQREAALTVQLPPMPVAVDTALLRRTPRGVELRVTGFDNTHSASEVSFVFTDTQGKTVGTEPIRVNVESAFRGYFSKAALGGVFALVADFPVAGDAALIGSVEVEFTNTAGNSSRKRAAAQ
jgi:hypothetical protein